MTDFGELSIKITEEIESGTTLARPTKQAVIRTYLPGGIHYLTIVSAN